MNASQSELNIVNVHQATITVPISHWLMSTSTIQHVTVTNNKTCFEIFFDDDITMTATDMSHLKSLTLNFDAMLCIIKSCRLMRNSLVVVQSMTLSSIYLGYMPELHKIQILLSFQLITKTQLHIVIQVPETPCIPSMGAHAVTGMWIHKDHQPNVLQNIANAHVSIRYYCLFFVSMSISVLANQVRKKRYMKKNWPFTVQYA